MEEFYVKFRSIVGTTFYSPVTRRLSQGEALEYLSNTGIEVLDFGATRQPMGAVDLTPLIDLALATNDRAWFEELTERRRDMVGA